DGREGEVAEQHLADACGLLVTEERHGNDEPHPPALAKSVDTSANEELVQVLLAAARGLEGRRSVEKTEQFLKIRPKLLLRQHIVRRIADDAVEPGSAFPDLVLVLDLLMVGFDKSEKDLGEFNLPVEKAVVRPVRQCFDLGDQPTLAVIR